MWPCICLCQLNCLPNKQESFARTLCSWTFPSQDGITDMDHVAVMVTVGFFFAGLKHWFQMCTLTVFHARTHTNRNTNALIHSNMYSQLNPVSRNKKAARLSWGLQKFIHFLSIRFGRARLLMKSLAELYTVTSPWVVNLQSSDHSHLPLVNRIKCSA